MSLYDLGTLSVKRIGEELDLASNTLTPLLKRMEQRGLLARERSKEDERIVLLTITESGKKLREEAYDLPQILLEKSQLSDDEWSTLTKLLEKLHHDTKS